MHELLSIPAENFPLHWDRYSRLMDEIQEAARGFAELGDRGWPRGREIDGMLMKLHHDLWEVWNVVTSSERELRERATATPAV